MKKPFKFCVFYIGRRTVKGRLNQLSEKLKNVTGIIVKVLVYKIMVELL